MKKTFKKFLAVIVAFVVAFGATVFASADSAAATASDSLMASLSAAEGEISTQAGESVSVTKSLVIDASLRDPTEIITVIINNAAAGDYYNVNWTYDNSTERVVDPPVVIDKGETETGLYWKLSVTGVREGEDSIPFTITNTTKGTTLGTKYCSIVVTAPTLTLTPPDVTINLGVSTSQTINAVVTDCAQRDNLTMRIQSNSSYMGCEFVKDIANGKQIRVTSNTAGTYYLSVTLINDTTGYNILNKNVRVTVKAGSNGKINATSVEAVIVRDFGDTNTAQFSAVINPSNADVKSIRWTSSNTSIATVDSYGAVTTYGNLGEATITVTVTNYDGSTVSDSIIVTVYNENGNNNSGGGILEMIINFFMMIFDFLFFFF